MMLTASGVVKLMDFGIAKASVGPELTMTGTTLGSLYYMSPEQIRADRPAWTPVRHILVGVSLYEMVTGTRPFDGDSQFAIMSAHMKNTPMPPVALDPTCRRNQRRHFALGGQGPQRAFSEGGGF